MPGIMNNQFMVPGTLFEFRLFFHFLQLRQHHEKHCDHTSGAANDIGDGLRYKHAVGSEVEDARKEKRERHDHHYFAEEGEKDSLLLLAQRFKSGLTGVSRTCRTELIMVYTEIMTSPLYFDRVLLQTILKEI